MIKIQPRCSEDIKIIKFITKKVNLYSKNKENMSIILLQKCKMD